MTHKPPRVAVSLLYPWGYCLVAYRIVMRVVIKHVIPIKKDYIPKSEQFYCVPGKNTL